MAKRPVHERIKLGAYRDETKAHLLLNMAVWCLSVCDYGRMSCSLVENFTFQMKNCQTILKA